MQYLSDDWFRAADEALRAAAKSAPAHGLIIDQYVSDDTSYRVTIGRERSGIDAIAPAAVPADATFTQSVETARAVASGATDAHQAFLLGHITFEGDIDILIERRDALDWLEQALAPVMATTTFG